MLQAIDTVYNGYRFRSRLEARWAVFFDALKIEYLYEPEGYILHDDTKYLPDFFLSDIHNGIWIEVKPQGISGDTELRKLEMLCSMTDHPGMIVSGDPMVSIEHAEFNGLNDKHYPGWWIISRQDSDEYSVADGPYIFCMCPWCGKVGIEYDGRGARVCGYRAHFDAEEDALAAIQHMGHWRADDKCYTGKHPAIVKAAEKARQARFEHGENGA